ncbi:hypothetical protein LIZ64_08520 [[Clostridium] hylemonae]|uniref:hypothetical protein n=1 Tax=[Clostridium] hylemonae TaxID=89153 RepID=UPI001D096326|nr:hypothetical protein [[Clostridium] hylemonae]MCB7521782.1 hypothetical protein [[Clostridium] hylemonae]
MNDCDIKILNLLYEWGNLGELHIMLLARHFVKDVKQSLSYLLDNGYIKTEYSFNQSTYTLTHKGYKTLGYTEVIRKRLSESEFYSLEIFRYLFNERYVSLENITIDDCESPLFPSFIVEKDGYKCAIYVYTCPDIKDDDSEYDYILRKRDYALQSCIFDIASKAYRSQLWFITKENVRMRKVLEKYAIERDVKIATFELEEVLARI